MNHNPAEADSVDARDVRSFVASSEEVARTLRRADRASAARQRRRKALASATVLAVCATAALPSGRAAATEAFGQFSGFFSGNETSPGTALDTGAAPGWPDGARAGSARVIAGADGEILAGYRSSDGQACLSYGRHSDECDTDLGWKERLGRAQVAVLMTSQTVSGAVALWGVTGPGVETVRLRFQNGPAATIPGVNGFVAVLDPTRVPERVEALNASGAVVGSADVDPLP